jgi:hypothetical protein
MTLAEYEQSITEADILEVLLEAKEGLNDSYR